jgi:hypothetical protein
VVVVVGAEMAWVVGALEAAEGERVGRRQSARSAPIIHPPQALAPVEGVEVVVAAAGDPERDQISVSVLPPRHVPEP